MKLEKLESISNTSLKLLIEEAIKKKCGIQLKAKGSSMKPFILNQDVVTIYPYLNTPPSIGDIAAFIHPVTNKILIHRIIKKNKPFTFKGDNMFLKDGRVEQYNILGFIGKIQRGEKNYIFEPGKSKRAIAWLSRLNVIFTFFFIIKIIGILIALLKPEQQKPKDAGNEK